MEIKQAQDETSFVSHADRWLLEHSRPGDLVFLPAGNTPVSLYQYWESLKPSYLSHLRFQQLDEVLTGPQKGHFSHFFQTALPSYQSQFLPLTFEPEIPDIIILGVGMNGHVAFHEPHIHESFNYGCVQLAGETLSSLGLKKETWGLTYGLGTFLKAKSALILISGAKKAALVQRLKDPVDESLVVCKLKRIQNLSILIL